MCELNNMPPIQKKNRKRAKNITKKEINTNDKLIKNASIVFGVLLAYYFFIININFFFDWDTIYSAISLKQGGLSFWGLFGGVHMITIPLVYISTLLISPFYGWDPLIGWKLLVLICASGAGALMFMTIYELKKNKLHALISTMFLAGSFGYIFLTQSLEDNIVNSFFVMLFIFAFLNLIGEIDTFKKLSLTKGYIVVITGISLGLAIATHIESLLFTMMVLSIYFFKKSDGIFKNTEEIAKIAVGVLLVIGPVVIINAIMNDWKGISDLINFFLPPGDYYRNPDWWYFTSGRSFGQQLDLVAFGLTALFFQRYPEITYLNPGFLNYNKALLIALFLLFAGYAISSYKSKTTQSMVLMFILLVPHSIFYASYEIERWNGILLPLAVILGNSLTKAKNDINVPRIKEFFTEHGTKIAGGIVGMLIIGSLMSMSSLTNFQENRVYQFADIIDSITPQNSVIISELRSDSELGLYVKYRTTREVVFLQGTNENILQKIQENINNKRRVYATKDSAGALLYYFPEAKKFSYKVAWNNNEFILYEIT